MRHDFAEIWAFKYGFNLGIGTLKNMASTGIFVRIVCALEGSIICAMQTPSMILTYLKHWISHSHQKMGPARDLYEGRQHTEEA
jgi:hypothetical protein